MSTFSHSLPGRALCLLLIVAMNVFGCGSPYPSPAPGLAEFQRPGLIEVPGGVYNAAGVSFLHERVDIENANPDDVLATLDVNAVGAVRAMKHLGRFVKNGGLVTLISSEAGSLTDNWRGSEYGYCMSKAAVNAAKAMITR